ncbi:MAG TPA: 2TM domain-containing protein [Phototrophicaceae bacterium]|nr:2TM domain-containing protein [Phototrophicaceae bacterium]
MNVDDPNYATIRQQVEIELQQKRNQRQTVYFLVSGFIFLLFIVMMLLILPDSSDFLNRDSLLSVIYFLTTGWIITLVLHGLSAFRTNSRDWARWMRKRLTEQALEDATSGLPAHLSSEKNKRDDRRWRLTDAGESLAVIDDEDEDHWKRDEKHAR